jgi:TfoX/Sxy family transcriptional regulator of competence genes
MAYDEQLTDRVSRLLKRKRVTFETKRMMGGLTFMVDGKMCVGVSEKRLMARIDPEVYETALKRKGCVPMDFTGKPMRGFVFIEPRGFKEDADLKHWVDLALDFNPRAKSSRKR